MMDVRLPASPADFEAQFLASAERLRAAGLIESIAHDFATGTGVVTFTEAGQELMQASPTSSQSSTNSRHMHELRVAVDRTRIAGRSGRDVVGGWAWMALAAALLEPSLQISHVKPSRTTAKCE